MLLILASGLPDFSAISRSCSIRKPWAGLSPSIPPVSPRGTLRFERYVPSSYNTSNITNSEFSPGFLGMVFLCCFFAVCSADRQNETGASVTRAFGFGEIFAVICMLYRGGMVIWQSRAVTKAAELTLTLAARRRGLTGKWRFAIPGEMGESLAMLRVAAVCLFALSALAQPARADWPFEQGLTSPRRSGEVAAGAREFFGPNQRPRPARTPHNHLPTSAQSAPHCRHIRRHEWRTS